MSDDARPVNASTLLDECIRLRARNADLLAALKSALPAIDYVAEDMPGYDGVPWETVAEETRAAIAQEEQG